MTEYFGKYRGKVEGNLDPLFMGRLLVSVPAVTGEGTLNWALPSVPFAGNGVGFWAIPPEKANVWVEYEGGNPDIPIWTGCFWDTGQAPATPALADLVVLKTKTCTLTLSELPGIGGITIETSAGMKISMTATGLEITNGGANIKLQGPRTTVNNMAVALLSDVTTVSGCSFQVPIGTGTKPQPCVKVQWLKPALRVKVMGEFVLLQDSKGLCQSADQIPAGPPNATATQQQVTGE